MGGRRDRRGAVCLTAARRAGRLVARAVLNKAHVEGQDNDRENDMNRTPSEWEREFVAQQAAAMAETACAAQPRLASGDSQGAHRTASDWVDEFEKERHAVMNA